MGTRSIVGIATESGFRGRYVHWDGYPEGVGQALAAIVKRDGTEKAIQVLTEDHYGWSSVTGAQDVELGVSSQDGRFAAVPGYGVAYTTVENQCDPNEWYDQNADNSDAEYAYGVADDAIQVWRATAGGWCRFAELDIATLD